MRLFQIVYLVLEIFQAEEVLLTTCGQDRRSSAHTERYYSNWIVTSQLVVAPGVVDAVVVVDSAVAAAIAVVPFVVDGVVDNVFAAVVVAAVVDLVFEVVVAVAVVAVLVAVAVVSVVAVVAVVMSKTALSLPGRVFLLAFCKDPHLVPCYF